MKSCECQVIEQNCYNPFRNLELNFSVNNENMNVHNSTKRDESKWEKEIFKIKIMWMNTQMCNIKIEQ